MNGRSTEPLAPRGIGLFEARLEGVVEGARYRYRLDGERYRPDPASRYQPEGVHGPSVVVDPSRFAWTDQEFPGHAMADLVFTSARTRGDTTRNALLMRSLLVPVRLSL